MRRSEDIFIGAKLPTIDPKIVPRNTLLNLGSSDPERLLRRKVCVRPGGALARMAWRVTSAYGLAGHQRVRQRRPRAAAATRGVHVAWRVEH